VTTHRRNYEPNDRYLKDEYKRRSPWDTIIHQDDPEITQMVLCDSFFDNPRVQHKANFQREDLDALLQPGVRANIDQYLFPESLLIAQLFQALDPSCNLVESSILPEYYADAKPDQDKEYKLGHPGAEWFMPNLLGSLYMLAQIGPHRYNVRFHNKNPNDESVRVPAVNDIYHETYAIQIFLDMCQV